MSQTVKILKYLRDKPNGGASSWDLRSELGICDPSARICDLIADGHNIHKRWQIIHTEHGAKKMRYYTLLSDPNQTSLPV